MIETAVKGDLFLDTKLIIPENKLEAIRIMNELHPVVGGQPTHEQDQPNDNNPILDLACTLANIHASGVGAVADLRAIQNKPPEYFFGKGFMSGISSLKGNGIIAVFGQWRDSSGKYAIKQFYYTDKEISYRNALDVKNWSGWIDILTSNSELDYNKLLNVPITSTLSDDKTKIASIFTVNEVNRKANIAQTTANNADSKAMNAQKTADTGVANAKTADDKAGMAQARADEAFSRVKPITEGGTGAVTVAAARVNLGLKSAAVANLTSTLSDAKNIAASIFSVNEVNRKASTAQSTANNADAKAVNAQRTADEKWEKQQTIGSGHIARMSEVDKKRDQNDMVFSSITINAGDYAQSVFRSAGKPDVIIERTPEGSISFIKRIMGSGSNVHVIGLPLDSKSGTLALTSDIPKNTASLSENGWWKCATTGVIHQWGTVNYSGNPGETSIWVNFPIAFNNVLNIQLTRKVGAAGRADADGGANIVTLENNRVQVDLQAYGLNSGNLRGVTWYAIGY